GPEGDPSPSGHSGERGRGERSRGRSAPPADRLDELPDPRRLGVVRDELEIAHVVRGGLGALVEALARDRAVLPRERLPGIALDRRVEVERGAREVVLPELHLAAVAPGFGDARVEGERSVERGEGALELALVVPRRAEHDPGV